MRSKTYQLPSWPQIYQSFPLGHPTLPSINIQNPVASGVFQKDLLQKQMYMHPQNRRMQFTSFDHQCPLLLSVGSGDSGTEKVQAGGSSMGFPTFVQMSRTHSSRLWRSWKARKDWATGRPEEPRETGQLNAMWIGFWSWVNSNVPMSPSFSDKCTMAI